MNMDGVLTCRDCNPPNIGDANNDYWSCDSCNQKFRLDRDQRTWWPEQLWDKRNDKPTLPAASNTSENGGQQ